MNVNTGEFNQQRLWGPSPKYPEVLKHKSPGDEALTIFAGPCSIESEAQVEAIAKSLAGGKITAMRGGVFRAGTYPGAKFGLQKNLLRMWSRIAKRHGLKIIVEVIDIRDLEYIDQYADAFQVGARQAQGYALLTEIAKTKKVVTLKRGSGMKLDEFLGAAEYLARGRCQPILIERGGASIHNHVRWDLSISLIAAVKRMTGMLIIVDASHGTGRRDLVEPMTLAGIAAGADGFLVEVHPNPEESMSDADQAYPLELYNRLLMQAARVHEIVRGKR